MDIKELRSGFMDYMRTRFPNDSNISSTVSMAFFLDRYGDEFNMSFEQILSTRTIPNSYKGNLESHFQSCGRKSPRSNAAVYDRSLRLLLEYLDGKPPISASQPDIKSKSKIIKRSIPTFERFTTPSITFTVEDLNEAERLVTCDPRYGEEAAIVNSAFNKFPKNVDSDIIAMKISLIDMTNSTNLNKHLSTVQLTSLIDKIQNCNFDERVAVGDISLVGELANNKINLFSFFSKYCLNHNFCVHKRDDFVIYDSVLQSHIGKFIANYEYKGVMYKSSQLKGRVEEMRKTYDYEGYLKLIDTILVNNNICCENKHRKFDWFIWYKYRKEKK